MLLHCNSRKRINRVCVCVRLCEQMFYSTVQECVVVCLGLACIYSQICGKITFHVVAGPLWRYEAHD
jgi:hypothetical protein